MTPERILGAALRTVLVVVAGSLAACDSGPSGPGSLAATVESARHIAGGVVVEIRGAGIRSFEASGATRVYWGPATEPGAFRVVLVNVDQAPLTFSIRVDDVAEVPPTATVIEATSLTNQPLPDLGSFELQLLR